MLRSYRGIAQESDVDFTTTRVTLRRLLVTEHQERTNGPPRKQLYHIGDDVAFQPACGEMRYGRITKILHHQVVQPGVQFVWIFVQNFRLADGAVTERFSSKRLLGFKQLFVLDAQVMNDEPIEFQHLRGTVSMIHNCALVPAECKGAAKPGSVLALAATADEQELEAVACHFHSVGRCTIHDQLRCVAPSCVDDIKSFTFSCQTIQNPTYFLEPFWSSYASVR